MLTAMQICTEHTQYDHELEQRLLDVDFYVMCQVSMFLGDCLSRVAHKGYLRHAQIFILTQFMPLKYVQVFSYSAVDFNSIALRTAKTL